MGTLPVVQFCRHQTIKNGTVKIELIEGKTNAVEVQGNKYTKSKYISKRMSLKQGEVANINKLNDDLLRFNAANDVQLRISLQAGSEPGTTDYVISAYEPQNITWTVYSDNAGSDTSGEYRGGLFFTDRSLTGVRDAADAEYDAERRAPNPSALATAGP